MFDLGWGEGHLEIQISYQHGQKFQILVLTVSCHANIDTFDVSTLLALVPGCLVYHTVVIPLAVVFQVFLYGSSKETLYNVHKLLIKRNMSLDDFEGKCHL